MVILMLFNDYPELTYDQIKTLTGIQPENEFIWYLLSLMKMRIVLKKDN